MKKYLKYDDEVRRLTSDKELKEYLRFRKENDEWIQPFINEMGAVGIPNEPLLLPLHCKGLKVQKNGYKHDIPDIDYEDEENRECIEDTGLFLVYPYKNNIKAFPTRRIAFASICKRADDDCGIMYRFDTKPNKGVLPIEEKAQRLCRDYQLYSDNCKILFRDGKVSAVLSKNYQILPAEDLILALEKQFCQDHPDFRFDNCTVSHEYLMVEYLLNNREMEESFRLALNDAGADISEIRAGVRFSTSDVGMSKVYVSLFYDADGVRTSLGSGIEMEHKNGASIELFADGLTNIGNSFKECEEKIEELGNIDIFSVSRCISRICETYPGIFPKQITETVVSEADLKFKNGGTAIDVYLCLNDIIQRHAAANELTPTRYLNLCEQVSRLMKLPYDRIDKGEDFVKI